MELALLNNPSHRIKPEEQDLNQIHLNDLDAEEVGKVVGLLQDEIKIIKLQLENLPGYEKGKLTKQSVIILFFKF
jgi:hypothetical protein